MTRRLTVWDHVDRIGANHAHAALIVAVLARDTEGMDPGAAIDTICTDLARIARGFFDRAESLPPHGPDTAENRLLLSLQAAIVSIRDRQIAEARIVPEGLKPAVDLDDAIRRAFGLE